MDKWLQAAFHSTVPEWRAFVRKLRQDHAAVQAGPLLKWNNGPVESHINRLKLVKRSMYGRTNFDLLLYESFIIESEPEPRSWDHYSYAGTT